MKSAMKNTHAAPLMSMLLVCLLSTTVLPVLAQSENKPETIRAEIGKPLTEAQALLKNKQFAESLAKIQEADNVTNHTPLENFNIDQLRGAAALGAGNLDLGADSFQRVLDSGRLGAAEQQNIADIIASTYYNAKNYPKAVLWGQRYIKLGGTSEALRLVLLQSEFLTDDHAAVVATVKAQLQKDDQAGIASKEIPLQMLAESARKINDTPSHLAALERLVQQYPKPKYWSELVGRIPQQPGFSDRYTLDVLRLQHATGNLKTAADYTLMAELAMQATLPAEALAILEEGYAAKILGSGPTAARDGTLRQQARTQAAADQKILADTEAAAQKSASGTSVVNIGVNYLGQKQFARAATLIEQGINKGGLKRPEEAKLHLGIALQQAGDRVKAQSVFKSVQGNDGSAALAHLWGFVQ